MAFLSLMEKRTRNQVFEFRVPRKKNNKIFWKVPSKIYGSDFIMQKQKHFFGLPILQNIITEKWGYYVDKMS